LAGIRYQVSGIRYQVSGIRYQGQESESGVGIEETGRRIVRMLIRGWLAPCDGAVHARFDT